MPAPQQLRDRAAERVADSDDRTDVERIERGGRVVGTVGEPEAPAVANAPTMPPHVDRDHVEVLAQRVEHAEPVEAAARHPTVKQQQRWSAGWSLDTTHERRAAAGKHKSLAHGERWTADRINGQVGVSCVVEHRHVQRDYADS